jgi:hypothetical protein
LEISQRALHTTNSKYTEETGVQAKEVEKSPLIFSYGTFGQKKRGVFWVAEGGLTACFMFEINIFWLNMEVRLFAVIGLTVKTVKHGCLCCLCLVGFFTL